MLAPYQIAWLNSLAKRSFEIEDVKDCDPSLGTVTFQDGRIRTVVDAYTRVMGYHRPTNAFNEGKKQEHRDRKYFVER